MESKESSIRDEAKKLPDELKKIQVKPPASPTCFLAKNAALVPSQVARLKQIPSARMEAGGLPVSSGSATGNPRNKTALAPGHSLMDWIRLGSSGIDLTGVGGVTQNVTLKELANHNKRNDAWIAIRGIVFNVTKYMDFHPGGVSELMRGVGKDATKLFNDVHAWVNYQSILQKCVVGRLTRGGGPCESASITGKTSDNRSTSGPTLGDQTNPSQEMISKAFSIKVDWKQTTNSISFIYKPSPVETLSNYRLTRLNATELALTVHHGNTVIRHDYEFSGEVNWPPNWRSNPENGEIEISFTKSTGKLWDSFGNRTVVRESKSIERTYKEYKVVSNTEICEGIYMLIVSSQDYMEIIPVGRHMEAKMKVMEMEVSRYYTPVPTSLRAGYNKPDSLCLMIKRYGDGALSPSITALKSGQTLTLSNALGGFAIESFDDCSIIHMLAAGTGLTPMLGIIHRALGRRTVRTINLLNFNRKENNIFYGSQLENAAKDKKLKVVNILSQPDQTWKDRTGVVTESLIRELVGVGTKGSCVFSCGPKGFIVAVKEILAKLEWKKAQIHEFDG